MDKLKELLEKKKQERSQQTNSKEQKWVRRAEIDKKQEEEYLKEQKLREEEHQQKIKQKFIEEDEYYNTKKKVKKEDDMNKSLNTNNILNQNLELDSNQKTDPNVQLKYEIENEIGEPPLPIKEVKKRLRLLKSEATFFGETAWARYKRLKKKEEEQVDTDLVGTHLQVNQFVRDITINQEEYDKKVREIELEDEQGQLWLEKLEEHKFTQEMLKQDDNNRQKRKIDLASDRSHKTKCQDVYIWFKKIFRDWWELKFEKKKDDDSVEAKRERALYFQYRRDMGALFDILKSYTISQQILDNLYHVIHYAYMRNYIKAHEKYLELAIGNAPWPMGVTMVGIHERTGREKIFSSQVAHILNDDIQRKYLVAVNQVIQVAQSLFPNEDKTQNFGVLI